MAGQSRLAWRPLVTSIRLFCSAYNQLGTIAWTPNLFTLGPQLPGSKIVADALGYKIIESKGGRIKKHLVEFVGGEFAARLQFLHYEQLLPNPFAFARSASGHPTTLRPLLGPVHGDCHAQNLFVRARQDAAATDVYLIDLATYQSSSLIFFDHAYLELATMLRQMDHLGERRWLEFVIALARDSAGLSLEPNERGWLEDVLKARSHVFDLAGKSYPDRMDDLKLQFLLAHVAAGLAFLHKIPRMGSSSGGLSESQYRQSLIWSAVFLRQFHESMGLTVHQMFPNELRVPVLGNAMPDRGPIPSEQDWQRVKYFDAQGFNVIIVSKATKEVPAEILDRPWALLVDFREHAPSDTELGAMERLFRQTWPSEPIPDTRLLTRGGIWYFANGRSDLSGVPPTATSAEWRRHYRRPFENLLLRISETTSPTSVRAFVFGDGLPPDQLRFLCEDLDTAFHEALAPVVVASHSDTGQLRDEIPIISTSLEAAIIAFRGERAATPARSSTALLPRRAGGAVGLAPIPLDLLSRVSRDLTVLFRNRAQAFPPDRIFGVDFRRGMSIEWAELAQNLDVPRVDAFDLNYKAVDEALKASSNHTINLLHEPSAGGTTLSRRLAWEFMERFPVVSVDQISTDTASYLRDLFQFCSLPVLVLMEATIVTESERESLLRQLREDNTRAVFLWVSRAYGRRDGKEVLVGRLGDSEAALFRDAYLEQVADEERRAALMTLSNSSLEQRNPFFSASQRLGSSSLALIVLSKMSWPIYLNP